jgi:hypothetical protein
VKRRNETDRREIAGFYRARLLAGDNGARCVLRQAGRAASGNQLCQAAKVLRDGGERKLILRTAWASQPKSARGETACGMSLSEYVRQSALANMRHMRRQARAGDWRTPAIALEANEIKDAHPELSTGLGRQWLRC